MPVTPFRSFLNGRNDIPEQFGEIAENLATGKKPQSIHEKFDNYMERIKVGKEHIPEEIEKIFREIKRDLKKAEVMKVCKILHD